MEFEVEEACEK